MRRKELLENLAQSICSIETKGPMLVGIDGVDGAGKTTLANELVPYIELRNRKVARASIDGFHNPREKRIEKGALSPEGYYFDSFDYDFLVSNLLNPLKETSKLAKLSCAKHDWKTERAVDDRFIEVDPMTIVLFEGVFLYRPEIEKFWDYKIYVQISPDTSLARGIMRDSHLLGGLDSTREKYLKRYIPGQTIYHKNCKPDSKADIVINNDDHLNPIVLSKK